MELNTVGVQNTKGMNLVENSLPQKGHPMDITTTVANVSPLTKLIELSSQGIKLKTTLSIVGAPNTWITIPVPISKNVKSPMGINITVGR